MKKDPDQNSTDSAEIEALITRIERGQLRDEDAQLLARLLLLLLRLITLLQHKNASLEGLRSLVSGRDHRRRSAADLCHLQHRAPPVWGEKFFAFAPTKLRAPCLCIRSLLLAGSLLLAAHLCVSAALCQQPARGGGLVTGGLAEGLPRHRRLPRQGSRQHE